jgi:hypothetical protein
VRFDVLRFIMTQSAVRLLMREDVGRCVVSMAHDDKDVVDIVKHLQRKYAGLAFTGIRYLNI